MSERSAVQTTMKFSKHISTFSFLIFCEALLLGQSQSVKFKHITVDNGLSQSWVRCITQDKTGFLWVGTDNGLNRYDGYNFARTGEGETRCHDR